MTDMMLAAPLAAALSAKGYETLTPVQKAVLVDEAHGRDALVSAQTGSGKTVAFGLAIAPEVLDGHDRLMFADKPLALVVAPTRELALQVHREFQWLYGEAGAHLASCVGGMDYRTERRALERGAHIVVGTPGRLRDHIERGSLDLSGIKAVVLDEADEMLDLGFAEDLEFILGSAPDTRRTLMFSATVPKEIEKLAATFQKNALRIIAQGEAKQHVDIEYRAISVAARDREHAIFNVLRFYEAKTAIVFCKTRVNVNHLMARMGNRGFQVVALSGELSQQERTHALQALRDGRARVCIATDVAARGIDLPGLELVIHADLPSNSETLLHRSGRTGRAGQKGVSALIVPPAEFRKAQRLLQGAKVVAEWAKAPSADDVQAKDDVRLLEHPALQMAVGDEAGTADRLLGLFGPEKVAAAFIRLWREGRSAPEELSDSAPPPSAASEPAKPRSEFGPSVWYALSVGHTGRAEARWILPKICDAGGIAKNSIGAIRVQQDVTYVQLADDVAPKFGNSLVLEAGLEMTRLVGEPDMQRPDRPARTFAGKPERAFDKPERRVTPRPVRDDAERPSYSGKPPRIVEDDDAPVATPVAAYAPREDVERKPYAAKPYAAREDSDRKPYAPRGDAERKPYTPREDSDRKPYAPRGDAERKPYAAKPYAAREDSDRKPYAPRGDAERKPYAAKPYAPREDGDRKPYAPRGDGDRKPYAAKPYAAREDGDRKPYAPRSDAPRSAGFKSHGGSADRPARAAGFKSHAAEGTADRPARAKPEWKPRAEGTDRPAKPRTEGFKPRAEGSDGRPFKARPGGDKPYGKSAPRGASGGKPAYAAKATGTAKPRTDARDTSKRFVPPKKK
jgi:ATP-dependent RNA helicase DeaD